MQNRAYFSPCRQYRYTLWREWIGGNDTTCAFVGLNPSTATDTEDDPTIRRCIGFAKSWGFSRLLMLNLFALRATDPQVMLVHPDPVGPENDTTTLSIVFGGYVGVVGMVVAAWGCHGAHMGRANAVREMLGSRLHYLRLNKDGSPAHPLYLPKTLTPIRWSS
jgi:hypothetical protein